MPNVKISKIKLRRGSDDQRKFQIFDQGEPIYTVDTKRLFIGTGTLSGGSVVGSKIHPITTNYYSISNINAEVGDICNVNNKFYQLTASDYTNVGSWADVSLRYNSLFFNYDSQNRLDLNTDSISAKYIKSSTVYNGIKIENGVLQSDYNTKSFEISAFQLSLKANGIDEREINSTTLGNGLTGGSGSKISLNVDPYYFYFSNNTLSLSNLPTFTMTFEDLSASWFGDGLNYSTGLQKIYATLTDTHGTSISKTVSGGISINPSIFGSGLSYNLSTTRLSTTLVDVDNVSLVRNLTGGISIKNDAVSGTNQLAKITVDQFGRVTNQVSSIYGALTGNSALSSLNVSNSLSSIFNGTPSQTLSGGIPGLQIARFTATDINGYTVTLSSAGFITFEGPTTTRNGSSVGRFAIPIFAY